MEIPTKEGTMVKRGEVVKNWKRRWFVLYGSMIFYYKKQGESLPAGWINLQDTTRQPSCMSEPPSNMSNCFSVVTPQREYLINADSPEDMYDWIQILRTSKAFLGSPSKCGFSTKASDVSVTRIEQLAVDIPSRIPVHKWKVNGKLCSNCIHGSQIVDYLVHTLTLETRADAVTIGQTLLQKGVIRATVQGDTFTDSSIIYTHSS